MGPKNPSCPDSSSAAAGASAILVTCRVFCRHSARTGRRGLVQSRLLDFWGESVGRVRRPLRTSLDTSCRVPNARHATSLDGRLQLAPRRHCISALVLIRRLIATRLLLRADSVSALLERYRRLLQQRYGATSIGVRPHGTLGTPNPPVPALRPGNEFRILALGKWGRYKRLETLLEALPEVLAAVPHASLLIAGCDHPNRPGYVAGLNKNGGRIRISSSSATLTRTNSTTFSARRTSPCFHIFHPAGQANTVL